MDFTHVLGLGGTDVSQDEAREKVQLYINLKLASSGQPTCIPENVEHFFGLSRDLLRSYREKNRLLSNYQCPIDRRIQDFLGRYLDDTGQEEIPTLPGHTFVLDRHGVARELSLPMDGQTCSTLTSSRATVSGRAFCTIQPATGAPPRALSTLSKVVSRSPVTRKQFQSLSFASLLREALSPPQDLMLLPFTADQPEPAHMFVSLLLRPVVCPAIPGADAEKSMEIRFVAPGNLTSNLDFVESIFGNGGNPNLAEFDAALDVEHWTGHSGYVLLAPHLTQFTKKALGLPHIGLRQRASTRGRHVLGDRR